jgi:hypothetical protein
MADLMLRQELSAEDVRGECTASRDYVVKMVRAWALVSEGHYGRLPEWYTVSCTPDMKLTHEI